MHHQLAKLVHLFREVEATFHFLLALRIEKVMILMINVIKIDVMYSSLNLKENIFYTDLFLQLLSSPLRETDDLDGHHEDDDDVGDGEW